LDNFVYAVPVIYNDPFADPPNAAALLKSIYKANGPSTSVGFFFSIEGPERQNIRLRKGNISLNFNQHVAHEMHCPRRPGLHEFYDVFGDVGARSKPVAMVIACVLMKAFRYQSSVAAVYASAVPQKDTLYFALGKHAAQLLL